MKIVLMATLCFFLLACNTQKATNDAVDPQQQGTFSAEKTLESSSLYVGSTVAKCIAPFEIHSGITEKYQTTEKYYNRAFEFKTNKQPLTDFIMTTEVQNANDTNFKSITKAEKFFVTKFGDEIPKGTTFSRTCTLGQTPETLPHRFPQQVCLDQTSLKEQPKNTHPGGEKFFSCDSLDQNQKSYSKSVESGVFTLANGETVTASRVIEKSSGQVVCTVTQAGAVLEMENVGQGTVEEKVIFSSDIPDLNRAFCYESASEVIRSKVVTLESGKVIEFRLSEIVDASL